MKYFLKSSWEDKYTKVTKQQYINAEKKAGFQSDEPGETATGGFSGHGISGRIKYEKEDSIHDENDYECF